MPSYALYLLSATKCIVQPTKAASVRVVCAGVHGHFTHHSGQILQSFLRLFRCKRRGSKALVYTYGKAFAEQIAASPDVADEAP